VRRLAAASQRRIVHHRQIVEDQRTGVHHFDGAGHVEHRVAGFAEDIGDHQRQHWAQAFARAHGGVAHGLVHLFRPLVGGRQQFRQTCFDPRRLPSQLEARVLGLAW